MNEPQRYEIVTVADFAKVPPHRLGACLNEFAIAIVMARATEKLIQLAQKELEQAGTIPAGKEIAWPMKTFTWIDDQSKTATLRVSCGESGSGT